MVTLIGLVGKMPALPRDTSKAPPHVFFKRTAEDHAEDEWPRRTIEPLENKAERAEPSGQKNIEHLAVDAVYTDTTERQDSRIEQAVGNLEQVDPEADHRQVKD